MKLEIVFKDGRKEIFDGVASFNVTEQQITNKESHASDVAQTLIEGKILKVNPMLIDRSKFETPMSDPKQEWTRQIIQEAFAEVDMHPEKFASDFYTLIPEKMTMRGNAVADIKAYANDLGGHVAYWVEQALEWAQRIFNGESWENICNQADSASWERIIVWKNGYARLVGGSHNTNFGEAASFVYEVDLRDDNLVSYAVPLTVIRF